MALTSNNMAMIKAISCSDMVGAKRAALASLVEDSSKKNQKFVETYKKILQQESEESMPKLPLNLKSVLLGSAPEDFDAKKYFLRASEADLLLDIMRVKKVSEKMLERGILYHNTVFLYGDSGTGKTEFGKYLACKLNLPFYYISFVSTIDSYMGSTAKNIHNVFDFCNSVPCILMLDEIDCIAVKRHAGGRQGADGELERTTIALMQELDRLSPSCVLLAATNRKDIVDDAVLRRFAMKHEIKNMTVEELMVLTTRFLKTTDTERYISEEQFLKLVSDSKNPGELMPKLIRLIAKGMYAEIGNE